MPPLPLLLLSFVVGWLLSRLLPGLVRMLRCRSIPALPGDRLLGGHIWMRQIGAVTQQEKYDIFDQVGAECQVARFNLALGLPLVINLLHPNAVATCLNGNTEAKDFFPYTPDLSGLIGNSVGIAGGARWRRNRALLKQAFGRKDIPNYFTTFRTLAHELVDDLEEKMSASEAEEGYSLLIDKSAANLTTETMMRCAFACENENWIESQQKYSSYIDEYMKLFSARYDKLINFSDTYFYHCTKEGKRMREIRVKVLAIAKAIIEQRRQVLREKSAGAAATDNKCIVDILLTACDPESGEGMSEDDLVYECNLFLFAGYDTSRLALTWLIYLLACHPEERTRCQQEVDTAFGGDDDLGEEGLSSLDYLTRCIKETLRHYPPLEGEARKLPEDVVIDGKTIPKGMIVNPVTTYIHHRPEFWEKPNDFYPDHFLPELVSKRPPEAFRAFSSGPRRCLGEQFAMEEIKTVAAYFLQKFDFDLDPTHKVELVVHGLLVPKDGVKILLRSRHE